ncbi:helix-turn-helix domain-containing protein [Lacticaseibacillus baoqingensis]|uniref:Helix-turn-helix domain-containing protein n=1 Tax=Lacticaseibacillus baoqingensis TaxID=2486013 RepID=A0ABW4E5V0_9LACO|nr:helix-turn-helix domain-containing protein [Lacticaseibacillus baoqingensis]
MDFAAIFLEKSDLQKYQLLQTLSALEATGKTIADLSNKLAFSYQRTYNLFQELSQDLAAMRHLAPAKMRQQLLSPGPLAISADHYLYDRLQHALPFLFFDYLVQGHQPSVNRFCAEHFISRSTLNRKLVTLRHFFAQYQIKLSLSRPGLIGPEPQIRLCLQTIYWQATHGETWPFSATPLAALKTQYQALPSGEAYPVFAQLDLYLIACSRLRIATGHVITALPLAAAPVYPVFDSASYPHLSAAQLAAENDFFAFYQATNLRLHTTTKQPASLSAWLPEALLVTQYLQQHLLQPSDAGYVALHANQRLIANIQRVTARFLAFGGNYPKACDFSMPERITARSQRLAEQLAQWLTTLPKTAPFDLLTQNAASFADAIRFLLAPYLLAAKPPARVNVKVLLAANDILNRQLSGFLDNLFFVTRMSELAPLTDADLVVCDAEMAQTPPVHRYLKTHPQALFSWYLDVTRTDFHQLYLKLSQLYQASLVPVHPKP